MMDNRQIGVSRTAIVLFGAGMAFLGLLGGWNWQSSRTSSIEKVVHNYILTHPEVLPEAMENLRKQDNLKKLSDVSKGVNAPFPGAILGNPMGKVTLVEFSDFACTYCRASEADVASLIVLNPDLRVVVRQLPILSPASADAARMGLAAARQGRYAAFHHAMYAAGRPDKASIEAAAKTAGLDLERARQDIADPAIEAEIQTNLEYAQKLGFDGTPSWVIGNEIHAGAVGKDVLAEAITKARS